MKNYPNGWQIQTKIMLPNFFIVGTPKAGTTSLYHYLENHPQVFMSPVKEPNYFSYQEITRQKLYYKDEKTKDFEEYKKLFSNVKNETVIGEASVSYLFYPKVPSLIKEKISDAKFVVVLRDPAERALSHYYMDKKFRYVKIPFEDVLYKRSNDPVSKLYYQQYIELGFYTNQVKRYLDTFGEKRVKIFLFDDLKKDIKKVIIELYDFLKIEKKFIPDLNKKHNPFASPKNRLIGFIYSNRNLRQIARAITPDKQIDSIKSVLFTYRKTNKTNEETLKYLREMYKPDIKKLEHLLNRDLRHWYE